MKNNTGKRTRPLGIAQLESFCHVMGRSIQGGLSFVEAAETYGRTSNWNPDAVCGDVRAGASAADAMKHNGDFPPLLVSMVDVGEAAGRLDQTFLRMADYYRDLIRCRRVFKQGVTWPALQLVGGVVVLSLLFLAFEYLQRTISVLVPPDVFGLGLTPLQNLALVWSVAFGLIAMLALMLWWLRRRGLPRPVAAIVRRVPFVGTTFQRMATTRFGWALGAAIDAGTDATTAMRLAVSASDQANVRAAESVLVARVRDGNSFETALNDANVFPPDLIAAVAAGESTGQLTESIERLVEDYDQQNALALRRLGQVCGLLVSLTVVAFLGGTVVVMYANYLGMVNGALRANSVGLERLRDQTFAKLGDESQLTIDQDSPSAIVSDPDNELLQTRDRMVKDFVENNEDFKQIESIYTTLGKAHTMTPNELLDALGGETEAQKRLRQVRERLEREKREAEAKQ